MHALLRFLNSNIFHEKNLTVNVLSLCFILESFSKGPKLETLDFLYRQYPDPLSDFDLYIRLFHIHSGGYGPEIELRFMSSTMYV